MCWCKPENMSFYCGEGYCHKDSIQEFKKSAHLIIDDVVPSPADRVKYIREGIKNLVLMAKLPDDYFYLVSSCAITFAMTDCPAFMERYSNV